MSKYEQYGSIKFSPTAVTDKEEVHDLHKRANGSEVDLAQLYEAIQYLYEQIPFVFECGVSGNIECNKPYEVFEELYRSAYPIVATLTDHDPSKTVIGYLSAYEETDNQSFYLEFRCIGDDGGFNNGLAKGTTVKKLLWHPDGVIEEYREVS